MNTCWLLVNGMGVWPVPNPASFGAQHPTLEDPITTGNSWKCLAKLHHEFCAFSLIWWVLQERLPIFLLVQQSVRLVIKAREKWSYVAGDGWSRMVFWSQKNPSGPSIHRCIGPPSASCRLWRCGGPHPAEAARCSGVLMAGWSS